MCSKCSPVGGAAFAECMFREAVYGGAAQSWAAGPVNFDMTMT